MRFEVGVGLKLELMICLVRAHATSHLIIHLERLFAALAEVCLADKDFSVAGSLRHFCAVALVVLSTATFNATFDHLTAFLKAAAALLRS